MFNNYCFKYVKFLILKTVQSKGSIPLPILNYNTTPKNNVPSPFELLMGRKLRSDLLMTKYECSKPHREIKRN